MVRENILQLLQKFRTFNLKELEAANLLERKDFKYLFPAKELPFILKEILPHYSILSINDCLYTDYLTHYFDTENFLFYTQHHNGLANRYKVRLRQYVQSAIFFYEVKFKNNKNWTSKEREKISSLDIDIANYASGITTEKLEKKLEVTYSRITLLSNDKTEKVTLDLNLGYANDTKSVAYPELCIAEVKSKTHHAFIFRQLLKNLGYRTQGLSKYCFGISNLYNHLKNNNFKKSFLYLRHLAS